MTFLNKSEVNNYIQDAQFAFLVDLNSENDEFFEICSDY